MAQNEPNYVRREDLEAMEKRIMARLDRMHRDDECPPLSNSDMLNMCGWLIDIHDQVVPISQVKEL